MTDPQPGRSNPASGQVREGVETEAERSRRTQTPRADQTDSPRERQAMLRLASAGFEIASFSLILGAMGYGIDQAMTNSSPYIGIVGLLLGFSLGFYRLIVLASKLS